MLAIIACLLEWKAELKSVVKPFKILSDHKNLSYFAKKRLLSERQARYSDILQQFNFTIEWRLGRISERPDALSRRDQDKPLGLSDERIAGRVIQLLPKLTVSPANITSNLEIDEDTLDQSADARIFESENMQELWKQAVYNNKDWQRARDAVQTGERSFPPDLAVKTKVNIAECSVAADGILRGRENHIWVPDYELLRTAIMQKTHDSHLTGHTGRDSMISILLRR